MQKAAQRLDRGQLEDFLARFSPVARDLAVSVRSLLLELFPAAVETAEGKDLGYGWTRGYKGLVFTINIHRNHVNLGLYGGAHLADPNGLLEGTGKLHRHVKIRSSEDLSSPQLRSLLELALQQRQA